MVLSVLSFLRSFTIFAFFCNFLQLFCEVLKFLQLIETFSEVLQFLQLFTTFAITYNFVAVFNSRLFIIIIFTWKTFSNFWHFLQLFLWNCCNFFYFLPLMQFLQPWLLYYYYIYIVCASGPVLYPSLGICCKQFLFKYVFKL